jgi:hypothetical protein
VPARVILTLAGPTHGGQVRLPEALREAAATAVRQWRYEPSDVGPTLATITVRFILDKGKGKDKP